MSQKTEVPPQTDPKTDDSQTDDTKIKTKRYNRRHSHPRLSKEEKAKLNDLADTALRTFGRSLLLVGKWFLQDEWVISEEQQAEMDELAKINRRALGEALLICGNSFVRHSLTSR